MEQVIERVMQTFGMMRSASPDELERTREVLLDFLSKNPNTDQHRAAVESLTFLRKLKT